ncbi:somatostatin receptor type 5-like [Amphiura filiformis]|uniref:somatostatin receptor type 5-like n=1 Tax=Amphiura filiformis TaxID=82378 RepID=UPI003B219DE8
MIIVSTDEMAVYIDLGSRQETGCDIDNIYNLSEEESEEYGYNDGQTALLVVILPVFLILGVIGNLAFIYVVLRITHMQTITNRYLISLAVADIIFLCSAVGHKLAKYAMSPIQVDDTPLGTFGCVWIYFLTDTAYFSSLFCVTLVSVDRYMAVCCPQNRKSIIKSKSLEIIFLSWIASAFLAACLTPGNADQKVHCVQWPDVKQYKTWPKVVRICSPLRHQIWISSVSTGLQTVPFFVTLVMNIVLYISIIKGLDKCIRRLSQHGVQTNADTGIRNQIAKMLVVNGLVFFCLLFPFEINCVFSMIATFRTEDNAQNFLISSETVRQYILILAQLCSYINSAVNPVVYTVMCRRYRQAFKKVFLPDKCMNKTSNRLSNSCRTGDIHFETMHQAANNETAV